MAQLNSLVVTGNSKFINDVNANTINLSVNSVGINFRPTNSGYYTTTSYQTSGNEALVFASKNAVTSFMFVNGEDSVTNHGDTRWRSLTPGLQIKQNCVSIGQLIDTNVTPTYRLLVNGTTRINEKLTVGSSAQATLPNAGIHVHDVRNVDATPGFLNSAVNFYFTNRTNPYANSPWYSVMHVNGWSGSESYNAWEIAGPAHNGDQRTVPLYVRTSNGGTWGSWRQIYDSSNKPDGVKDIGNSTNTTFACSKAGLNYADYTWLAGWNGYELRAINKNQFAQASHTHTINQVTWPGNQNLTANATANSQEWSIDLTPGSYTGTYFHVWSAKNSKSILQCFTDSNEVVVPSGNLKVTGGKTYNRVLADMLTGTGTAAQDKGSGVSPRYFPAKWTFNIGIATPADGDIVTIKIPVAGHDFGTFLSLDNGTTYKPISVDYGTGRLTTHYAVSRPITLIYDASGGTNSVYAAAGADARSNVTGGCWRVMNFWDSGNIYDRNRYNCNIKAWGTKIIGGNIIVGINGLYHHLKEGTAFDITYPILYLNGDCNASATTTNTYDIIHFISTTTQNTSWTAYKPVYIKGSLSGNTFTPISTTPLLQTVPTSEDNYYYMLLGIATATNTIYLQERHPIFAYRFNNFTEITFNANYTSYLKPVSSNTTPSFSSWSIPSGCYQVWGQKWTDNRLKYTPSGGSETTVTDSGDWTMWLAGNGTSNSATFNMRIDGNYYGNTFVGNLSGNATSASTSDLARRLQWTTVRMTTPNTHWNDAALRYYLSSSAMTTDKPRNLDGKIIHMPWDNDDGYASQMFVAHGQYALAALRCQNGNKDAWGSWMPMGVFSQTTPTSGQVVITDGTNGMIKSSGYTIAKSVPSNADFTNTHRPIQMNGTEILGNNTTVLNLKQGSNVTLTNSSGTVTIAATNTLNTAGSTDTSSKIFLIGATSQAANPQTYSDNEVYATSGVLTTKSVQVGGTAATMQYNSTNHCIDFIVT